MTDAIAVNLGQKPAQLSTDVGYCLNANLEALEMCWIHGYVATGRANHPTSGEGGSTRIAAMRERIKVGGQETPQPAA
jgi:hypothetical protein